MGNSKTSLTLLGALIVACSSDPTAAGSGNEKISTWGEEYIEQGIPAAPGPDDDSGFTDGWSVKYTKFLVSFHDVTVADAAGKVVAKMEKGRLVDNVRPGVKDLISFPSLEAKAYSKFSYAIRPPTSETEIVGGADAADLAMMVQSGYSLYVEGTATKAAVTKSFKWGFKTQTAYTDCHSAEENGISTVGVVITNNQTDETQLTTHGDHLFYDRLQSGDDAKKTLLRFEEKAASDSDNDGVVTLPELCAKNIDPAVYNPSGLPGATIGDFVISLARTVGHFRGEGECTVKRLDPTPAGVTNPCDEYK